MTTKTAIFLFDYSGVCAEPWRDAGYQCLLVDIQHPPDISEKKPGLFNMQQDLKKAFVAPPAFAENICFVAAFPPCDHLAVSGARWFKGKGLRALAESIHMFATAAEFCERSGAPYFIENPVSTISTYWRKPDYITSPHLFTGFEPADNYSKKTCLWTGNGFVMPENYVDNTLPDPDNRIHFCSPGTDRKNIRSKTPAGFARAVFLCNNGVTK